MIKKDFRDDINGLRAWAVVAVVLFHFGLLGAGGGFVGVDVFFVISGFLMTAIVVKGLEEQRFSILGFYLARARRIMPALLVLCAVLMLVGWFWLTSLDYHALASHTVSAVLFVSNITFWQEAGYFDTASHDKLLLHTWSLSVEWQFYILFPLVVVAIWKLVPGRRTMIVMFSLGFLLSLALSVVLTPEKQTAAFFLLPTRAWEMLAGGLVFLLGQRLPLSSAANRGMEITGLLLIVAAVFLFDSSADWPGWRALLPVAGAVLVMTAAVQGSVWTGSRLAQGIGSASYSVYLWHWPFVVALFYLEMRDSPVAIAAALALTGLFSWVSWRFVENPVRLSLGRLSPWPAVGAVTVALALVIIPSHLVSLHQGSPGRLPVHVNAVVAEADNKHPRRGECHVGSSKRVPECTYGGESLGAIVIGDSHAGAVIRAVERALPNEDLHVLDWTLGDCPTIAGVGHALRSDDRCGEFVDYALEAHQALPSSAPLIIINRSSDVLVGPNEPDRRDEVRVPTRYLSAPHDSRGPEFFDEIQRGIIETACAFAKKRPVYMVRPFPELKRHVPSTMGRALLLGKERRVSISLDQYERRHRLAMETLERAAEKCGITLLDPVPHLCSAGRCWGDKDGLPIYYDDDHLNERGAEELVPMFQQAFGAPQDGGYVTARGAQ